MATQNLVSAVISPELKASINLALDQLKNLFSFVITLTPEETKRLFKAGEGYSGFLEDAYNAVINFPDIMPNVFDKEEFKKDYEFAAELTPIITKVKSLLEALEKTQIAAYSDSMISSLSVYTQVDNNKDKVPGLNSVYESMAKYFKKSKSIKTQPK